MAVSYLVTCSHPDCTRRVMYDRERRLMHSITEARDAARARGWAVRVRLAPYRLGDLCPDHRTWTGSTPTGSPSTPESSRDRP